MHHKIMHLLNTGSYSGAESVVITIINAMRENSSYDFIYVSLDGSIRNVLKTENIAFIPIEKMSVSEVKRVIYECNPSIVHAHDFTASIICASARLDLPILSHLHNNSPWLKEYCLKSFAYLLSCRNYSNILLVSKSIIDEYVFGHWIKKKAMVISNPIDISKVQQKAKIKTGKELFYDIVFLGRLSPQKNPQRFISIISKATRRLSNMKAAMIGSGALEAECRQLIQQKKLSQTIDLHGFMENPYVILSQAKLLCITSDWEGFGLVAVEALSLGVPVLAAPVGGLPGIVGSDCGALCECDDIFVTEIERLLSNEVYWQEKSRNALVRANSLKNIDEYMATIIDIYQSV